MPPKCARGNGCLPLVSLFADPPHFTPASSRDLLRQQLSILCWMPLGSKLRKLGCEIILGGMNLSASTNRTTTTRGTRFDLRLPLVTFLTHPPDLAVTAWQHLFRPQWSIFCRMPLTCQVRKPACQVALPCQRGFPCTHWTTRSSTSSGAYGSLPSVSFLTFPPDPALTAVGSRIRSKRQVLFLVPLG